MKKTILTLSIISAIGMSYASYTVIKPLESFNGGNLPNGSIVFKNLVNWVPHEQNISGWSDVGDTYDCLNWVPLKNTMPVGESFTQTADDCKKVQERITQNQEINQDGEVRFVGAPVKETITIDAVGSRDAVGTGPTQSWNDFAISKNLSRSWNTLNWRDKQLTELPTEPYPLTNVNYLYFDYNPITNVDGLLGLKTVSGLLALYNTGLINVDGLRNLTNVGGALALNANINLKNVDGLRSLTSVGSNLDINSTVLENVNGLRNLTHVGGYLSINGGISLTDIYALSNLKVVGYIMMTKPYNGPKLPADTIFCTQNMFADKSSVNYLGRKDLCDI